MPFYADTRENILRYIQQNKLMVGDKLPVEMQLSADLGIGRLTLREALNALKEDGIVYSVQGKGTFIAVDINDHISNSLNYNLSVTEMIEYAGHTAGVLDFKKNLCVADSHLAKMLRVEEGSDILVCSRVRTADGKRVVYSVDYLAPSVTAAFLQLKDNNVSLYKFFEDSCGITVGNGTAELEPIVCDAFLAGVFSYQQGGPLMLLKQLVCSMQGEPLLWSTEYLRPDCFHFFINRKRATGLRNNKNT